MFLRNRFLYFSIFITFLIVNVFIFSSCTIVKHDQSSNSGDGKISYYFEDGSFNAKGFVANIWSEKIIPELTSNAIDTVQLISDLKSNRNDAETKYGRRKENTAPYGYIVKDTAVIKAVNTESAAATVELDTLGPDGKNGILIQIGPVIKGSTVRDVLSFIKFSNFKNQMEYADVSREMNFMVRDHILNNLDKSKLLGKKVSYIGVFSWDPSGKVLITPVVFTVDGE